jgi:Tol biopolymer transport system component
MSSDGSRLVFTTLSKNPQLYIRIDGKRTVWISEPENGENAEPAEVENSEPAQVHLQAVTPDGRNVFFITNSKLLTADTNEGPDLYRWSEGQDPAHEENLTLITNSGNVQEITGGVVPGVSEDGTKVYFHTQEDGLFVWDKGTSRLISLGVRTDAAVDFSLAATASGPGAGRVTPDGNWMAFLSFSTAGNDGVHALTGQVIDPPGEEGKYEMYLYSLKSDRLICVSCGSSLLTGSVSVAPQVTGGEPRIYDAGVRPRFLSDDGRVFFSTPDALVAQDTNGVMDTYEYDPHTGKVSLLSSGVGSDPSMFTEASPGGNDVFIVTRQRLVAEDHDSLVDLYDVRSDGGFPSLPAPQALCVADECQPQPSLPPAFGAPVTAGFAGSGNISGHIVKPVVRKSRGTRKLARALRTCRRKHGKTRRRRCEAKARKRYGKRNAGRAK